MPTSSQPGLSDEELEDLRAAMRQLDAAFPPRTATSEAESEGDVATTDLAAVLQRTAQRLTDNYPYFDPLYAGQMLKPPHPVARLAYTLAMGINPNNHALDGGRASSAMEREVVADLAAMWGWKEHLGHLTSGGTMANLEALWVAGRERPGKTILASREAHYTHARISAVLKLPFDSVATDASGRIDLDQLESRLARGDVGCVVATAGTTGFGSVDSLVEVRQLTQQHDVRLHVDAAYGGYFSLLAREGHSNTLGTSTARSLRAIHTADSVVIDPHKHGLQPYGCGAVLFADPAVGLHYHHDSPYTYFTSDELHLGEISLECSRAGAAAVALWATHQLLPPQPGGAFAEGLASCLQAARQLHARLRADPRCACLMDPELDIVVWGLVGEGATAVSRGCRRVFDDAADRQLHLALIQISSELAAAHWPGWRAAADDPQITCLRSVLMKPEHAHWVKSMWQILDEVTPDLGSS